MEEYPLVPGSRSVIAISPSSPVSGGSGGAAFSDPQAEDLSVGPLFVHPPWVLRTIFGLIFCPVYKSKPDWLQLLSSIVAGE